MDKPIKPNITIPAQFAANGTKTDFDDNKIQNGFDRIQPDILAGDNLNKLIDDTYKGLNYSIAGTDAINLINEGETLTLEKGKLISKKVIGASKEPLEIFSMLCDSTFVPKGSSKLNGTEYPAAMYQELWENKLAIQGDNTCSYEEYQIQMDTKGYCLKVAVDISRQTFKIPTVTDEQMSAIYGNVPVVGNGISLGLTDGVKNVPAIEGSANVRTGNEVDVGKPINTASKAVNALVDNHLIGVSKDPTLSGLEADLTRSQDRLTLHWFISLANGEVGDFQVHYNELAKLIDGKMNADHTNDNKPYIVTAYTNGTSGYNIYSNGFKEQWGRVPGVAAYKATIIEFPVPFTTENINIQVIRGGFNGDATRSDIGIMEITNTNFKVGFGSGSTSKLLGCWSAKGY